MRVRPLLTLLADGEFHSGAVLGGRLGISRAAVCKQVQQLRELGIEVHSVRGRGHRMPEPVRLLDAHRILSLTKGAAARFADDFSVQFSIDSTNAEAMRRVQAGARHCIVMAEHQTGGRGRRGRSWFSPLGHNIYMSMVWPFERGVMALEGLSLMCGLAVASVVEAYTGINVTLKWPNDVLLDGRKLAGILMEVQGDMEEACRVVIGVGINIRLPGAAGKIDQAFSALSDRYQKPVDRDQLAAMLIDELVLRLSRFEAEGFGIYQEEWRARDHYRGHVVCVGTGPDDGLTGEVTGVDEAGRLQLRLTDGQLRTLAAGEVFPSLRPAPRSVRERHDSGY